MTTPTLCSSGEALTRIGHDLPYSVLHRWVRNGAVTPTQPATGKGSDIGWTPHDTAALTALATLRQDLEHLGLPCPWKLVRELWDQLDTADTATIDAGTVHILIHLGPEP